MDTSPCPVYIIIVTFARHLFSKCMLCLSSLLGRMDKGCVCDQVLAVVASVNVLLLSSSCCLYVFLEFTFSVHLVVFWLMSVMKCMFAFTICCYPFAGIRSPKPPSPCCGPSLSPSGAVLCRYHLRLSLFFVVRCTGPSGH